MFHIMEEEDESKRSGQAKTCCEAVSEKLVEMLKRKYDVASNLRIQEPSKKNKPRLEAPPHQRTYDCCACNTSFSTTEALYNHMPTHCILLHDQNNMQRDDDDGGKGKRVYHWK